MKSKVAYTYGWTDWEINRMPHKAFMKYWISITPLEAEEMLRNMNIAQYPHMKRASARKFFNQIKRQTTHLIDKTGGRMKSYKEVMTNLSRTIRRG